MWIPTRIGVFRFRKFFRLMLGYDSLANHLRTNFTLIHDYKYNLFDIENMMPWEKFIYVDMLNQKVKIEENERRNQANAKAKQRKW